MRHAPILALALAAGLLSFPVAAGAPKSPASATPGAALAERGQMVFARNCAPCHGRGPGDDGSPTLPGTSRLEALYKGSVPAALELRTDLNAETLRYFVRNGVGAMPMFRKVELSDADIDAIAAYLKRSAGQQKITPPAVGKRR